MNEWLVAHQGFIIIAVGVSLLLSHFYLLFKVGSISTALDRLQISVVADRNKRPK